jgi:hypothetical protein
MKMHTLIFLFISMIWCKERSEVVRLGNEVGMNCFWNILIPQKFLSIFLGRKMACVLRIQVQL